MASTAVKYKFVTRDKNGTVLEFWDEKPTFDKKTGQWFLAGYSGPLADMHISVWQTITGMEFEPGTIKEKVQINIHEDD